MTARKKAAVAMPTPHETTKPRRLSAVIRVSKVNGREGEGFIAPHIQREDIEHWAKRNKVEIVSWHEELDKSGKTIDRAGLGEALDEVWAGVSDGLIVAKVDRYSRSQGEGLLAIRELDKKGKAFVAVKDNIEPGMSSTATGWLLLSFLLMMAEWYLRQITENWLTVRRHQIEAGIANHAPYGYLRNPKDHPTRPRRLDFDEDTVEWVVYMFERRAQGASWATIAKELDASKVPPPGGGACWLWSRVRSIVQNRAYLGELTSCGKGAHEQFVNLNAHPAIVDDDLFDRANAHNQTSARADAADFPLTGVLRCAGCGYRMNGLHNNGLRWYRCRRNYSWGRCPKPASGNADKLEALAAAEFFARYGDVLEDEMTSDERSAELAAAGVVLDKAKAALQRFIDSPATETSAEELGQEWYDGEVAKRNKAIAKARAAYREAHNKASGFDMPEGLDDVTWHDLDVDEQRGLLSAAFAVVALKWSGGSRTEVDVEDRIKFWGRNEPGAPTGLPGRGRTKAETITAKVPIKF